MFFIVPTKTTFIYHPPSPHPHETQFPSLEEERPDALEMATQAHQA